MPTGLWVGYTPVSPHHYTTCDPPGICCKLLKLKTPLHGRINHFVAMQRRCQDKNGVVHIFKRYYVIVLKLK